MSPFKKIYEFFKPTHGVVVSALTEKVDQAIKTFDTRMSTLEAYLEATRQFNSVSPLTQDESAIEEIQAISCLERIEFVKEVNSALKSGWKILETLTPTYGTRRRVKYIAIMYKGGE